MNAATPWLRRDFCSNNNALSSVICLGLRLADTSHVGCNEQLCNNFSRKHFCLYIFSVVFTNAISSFGHSGVVTKMNHKNPFGLLYFINAKQMCLLIVCAISLIIPVVISGSHLTTGTLRFLFLLLFAFINQDHCHSSFCGTFFSLHK